MDKRMQDVNKLINCLNKNADENLKQSIRTYSQSIFKSFLGQGANEDPSYWKNKIMNKVEQTYDSRSVMQCQEACTRFLNNNVISKKSQTLKMLYKLSQHISNAQGNQSFDSVFTGSQEKSNTRKTQNLNQTQATISANYQSNVNQSNVNNLSPTQPNLSNISNMYISNLKNSTINEQLAIIRERGCTELGIGQSQILKQITSRFMDIVGEYITVDSLGQSSLKPTIRVSDTVRKIVKELSQIGWLYSKIMEERGQNGAVAKALKLGVRQEMTQYFRWIAVIQNMIGKELTLRKLILWSYQPFEKLKWLAIVLQAAKPFHGCQIISIINSYRPQGSNSINELLNRLLTHLLQPLFQFIYNWVYRGQLTDENGQFFICSNKLKNSNEDAKQCYEWVKKFYLEEKNIPNLLDYDSAMKIFNAGKTIYFLKNHCKIDYNLDVPFFDVKTALSDKLYESTSILSANFKSWIEKVSKISSNYLVEVMFNKFDLKKHFNAIKMFYLAGKGDFIQALIDSLGDQLSKPKHQIAQHNLQRYISDAMAQSFPKINQINSLINGKKIMTIEQQIMARLTAKKVENGPQGWDVFNFQYSVQEPPLNTVFNQQVIERYQKIFNFLWKVKRVEQNLKELWVSSVKDYHHDAKLRVLQQCQILRQEMFHFINNLHGYLMISIQSSWNIFSAEIDKAKSFDEILKLQENLIAELLEITLNTPKSKHANSCLNSIFSVILSFYQIEKQLVQAFSDYTEKCNQYTNRKILIKRGVEFDEELEPPYFNSAGLQSKVRQTKQLYRKTFQRFYDIIKKDSQSRISTLCFRLDFSGYYSQAEFRV